MAQAFTCIGYDCHRFAHGRRLVLGGVRAVGVGIGDVIDLGAAGSITSTGGASLSFQPNTASRPIILGGSDVAGLVGAMLQTGALIQYLSVRELLTMVAAIYPTPLGVDEVLEQRAKGLQGPGRPALAGSVQHSRRAAVPDGASERAEQCRPADPCFALQDDCP